MGFGVPKSEEQDLAKAFENGDKKCPSDKGNEILSNHSSLRLPGGQAKERTVTVLRQIVLVTRARVVILSFSTFRRVDTGLWSLG